MPEIAIRRLVMLCARSLDGVPATGPTAPEAADWHAILQDTEADAIVTGERKLLSETAMLPHLAAHMVVLARRREAIPDLERLGFDECAYWLGVRTTGDPTQILLSGLPERFTAVLDYMRDHPELVGPETRRTVLVEALRDRAHADSQRIELAVHDLLELGPTPEDLAAISEAWAESTPGPNSNVHILGLRACSDGSPEVFWALVGMATDDRGIGVRRAAPQYLAQWAMRDPRHRTAARIVLRELLDEPQDEWLRDSLSASFALIGTEDDVTFLRELALRTRTWGPLEALCVIDAEEAIASAHDLTALLLEERAEPRSLHGLTDIAVALDDRSLLPLLERLEWHPELAEIRWRISEVCLQLGDADPNRRATRAAGWLYRMGGPLIGVLEDRLRRHGAAPSSLRPIEEERRRMRR